MEKNPNQEKFLNQENKCPECGSTMIGYNQGNTLLCSNNDCGYRIGPATEKPNEGEGPTPDNLDTIRT